MGGNDQYQFVTGKCRPHIVWETHSLAFRETQRDTETLAPVVGLLGRLTNLTSRRKDPEWNHVATGIGQLNLYILNIHIHLIFT